MSYTEIRAHLAEVYGWSFGTIDNMSFEQIDDAVAKGKKPKGIPVNSDDDIREINKHWRAYVGI